MGIEIRAARPADHQRILELVPRFSEFETPAWRPKAQIDAANAKSMGEALGGDATGSSIMVAEVDGQFAGFVHLQTKADYFSGEPVGYVSDIAVAPPFEGTGVARRLLDEAHAWAAGCGFRAITLNVFDANERAKRFYEKSGYRAETVFYSKPIDR